MNYQGPQEKFTYPMEHLLQHRQHARQVQKAKRTLFNQILVDQQSRNYHLNLVATNNKHHNLLEGHSQELQKKARMRVVNMYQRRDLLLEELAAGAANADE